jgi:hypothetical protein
MQVDQQIENGYAGHGVEVTGGLVRQQQRRIDDERPRNRHPLLLQPELAPARGD